MLAELGLVLLGLVVIAVIIAINGYFVAQEFAYMAVDRPTLRAMAEKGNSGARRALKVTNRTSFMLSGAQLGITITGLMVGYVAEPLVGESLGRMLGVTGIPPAVGITIGTVFALVLAAVVQMIFGELFPKNLAISNPTPMSLALARSTLIYMAAFGWLISFFDKASNGLLRLIRVEPVHDLDASANADDLEHMVEDSYDSGDLPEDLFVLLDRILDFPDRDVEHAMVPRSRTDFIEPETTIAEARELMSTSHTRYPVIGEGEEPLGVLHLSDVLHCKPNDKTLVSKKMREPLVVPTVMSLPEALKEMIETQNEMALVIDEYGGFAGVLTIEDLGEELLGEISDEHDTDEVEIIRELAEDKWQVPGSMPIDELERLMGIDIPEGDWETVSGLLIGTKGSLPELGEVLEIEIEQDAEDITSGEESIQILRAEVATIDRHIPDDVIVELVRITPPDEDADRDDEVIA
uniref:hemolysin family protein n=1 Tax=Aquiluna sp. TaxID=2053504 RepID=UPI0040471DE0